MMHFSDRAFLKLFAALVLYLSSLFAANTLGIKLMPFLFDTHLSVSVFSFPIVFIMTDVISEAYSPQIARLFVWAGLSSTIIFLLYSILSLLTPWSVDGTWVKNGYEQVFGISLRMSIASIVAYGFGEFQDVFAFSFFSRLFGKKKFWLRSLLSNIWSQFLDSALFMIIAFAGLYSIETLINMTCVWWAYKVLMGFCYTPLSYLALSYLREDQSTQTK